MLCKINPTVGGATNEQARAMNFLRAIQAICTASAGSTPSVLSQTGATASPSGADVITEIISNTEAGGWTSSANTNITSNYNTSFDQAYQVDLYRDSGKGAYPFRKLSFRTNPWYLFNNSYVSYPCILVSHGFNTTANAGGNYLLNTTTYMPDQGGMTNLYRFDVNHWGGGTNDADYHGFRPGAGEWLIASTSQYFIAMSGALGTTGNPGTVMYVGLRTTNSWENQYDDNPPLASFVYDGGRYYNTCSGSNASMWCRTFGVTGTVNSNPAWYRIKNSVYNSMGNSNDVLGNYIDPLSGNNYSGSATYWSNIGYDPRYYWSNEMQVPMLPGLGSGVMRSKSRQAAQFGVVPPVSDPATGTFVPPALPITFARNVQQSQNPGGTAIGLYKSLAGSDTYLQQYYTPGQTFVLNNESYYPYVIGNEATWRDMFLIRKA